MSLLELFCHVDDFLKTFYPVYTKHLIENGYKKRERDSKLSMGEVMTILISFQYSHYRDLKAYYLQYVCQRLRNEFPDLVCYKRFVALISGTLIPLCAYLQSLRSTSDGIAFVGSTIITVCHDKRISGHKVFARLAKTGKSTKDGSMDLSYI